MKKARGSTCEMKLEALTEHGTRTRRRGDDITRRGSWIISTSKLGIEPAACGVSQVLCEDDVKTRAATTSMEIKGLLVLSISDTY